MTANHRAAHRLHVEDIIPRSETVTAKVDGAVARPQRLQWHEILSVAADEDGVMIDRVLIAADTPAQLTSGDICINIEAIIDAALNFSAFLVVVPSNQLQHR